MNKLVNIYLSYTLRKMAFILFLAAVIVIFTGCKEQNYAPVASLEVNPVYGDAPLEVRIKVDGDDLNGKEDIKEYRAGINTEIIKSKTPIDITKTFYNQGTIKVYGEVIDSKNASNKTGTKSIEVYQGPFIDQSAELQNDVEIKYSATLSKVSNAELKVKKSGNEVFSEEISDVNGSGADYEKTFTYADDGFTKGNYEFVLTSDNLQKNSLMQIPNYKPTSNIGNITLNLEEDADSTIILSQGNIKPIDENPEDNPVPISKATSLDGKTQLTLNGYNLNVKALPDQTGNYQVEVEYGSAEGGLEKAVFQGNITAHTWKYLVNPFVQPNDTTKPIIWNNFTTTSQRNTRIDDRLYNYDKTDTISSIPNNLVCTDFASILATNMNGYPNLPPDSRGFYINNWHNIPMYTVTLGITGSPFHTIDAVIVGDYVTDITNWRFIEPQTDSTYTLKTFKDWGVYNLVINYTFVKENEIQGKYLSQIPMFEFIPDGNGGWKDSGYRSPDIKLIEERGK